MNVMYQGFSTSGNVKVMPVSTPLITLVRLKIVLTCTKVTVSFYYQLNDAGVGYLSNNLINNSIRIIGPKRIYNLNMFTALVKFSIISDLRVCNKKFLMACENCKPKMGGMDSSVFNGENSQSCAYQFSFWLSGLANKY